MLYRAEPHSDKTRLITLGFAYRKKLKTRTEHPMTVDLTTQIQLAGEAAAATAARLLRDGGLVAFPTETVYGLGADAANAEAIARLYRAKGRPAFNPLIAHVSDLAAAQRIARFNAIALALADAFWPGPLTLVLPKSAQCPVADLATAGLDTIALRVPAHPVARAILRGFGGAVVAPSANLSGHVSPTTAAHVQSDLAGRIDLIVDGGPVEVGIESTIVGCFDRPTLLRPGGISRADIERVLGRTLASPDPGAADGQPRASGMLASHYAPRAKVRLNAVNLARGEALLAFGPADLSGIDAAVAVMNLSERRDLEEAAANLFGCLRALDASGVRTIAVMPVPDEGLGEAINDRLRRAAVPQG
ncbi:Sua5/YciO/YrdC/YwlC [Nitrobacter sp. Nb-311A]|nr:Sua5/YciO/YrdC/YwlC [Nitrobacter sp. Nb-311A]